MNNKVVLAGINLDGNSSRNKPMMVPSGTQKTRSFGNGKLINGSIDLRKSYYWSKEWEGGSALSWDTWPTATAFEWIYLTERVMALPAASTARAEPQKLKIEDQLIRIDKTRSLARPSSWACALEQGTRQSQRYLFHYVTLIVWRWMDLRQQKLLE